MKYAFVAQYKKTWPVDLMCRLLGVKRNGFYRYQRQQAKKTIDAIWDEKIELVKEIAEGSKYTYGYRRMKIALNACGFPVTRGEAKRLMKAADITVKRRKKHKVTTDSNHNKPLYDNVLNRGFSVAKPNQIYAGDITYIWTLEGWLYLAVVIDLFSRRVVGWSMSSRMTSALVCDALKMAIGQRQPKAGLIVHTDRGSQYASHDYRKIIADNDFIGSMSRKGNCWDNAVSESFFGTLKQEQVHWCRYRTRAEAQQDILNYIVMHYNSKRLHSYLDYKSPMQFENELIEKAS